MEPVLTLRGVVAVLGRFPALAGVDLDVGAGSTVLLVGPNGAGKSTLLRLCAGLVGLTAGSATVLGHDLRTGRRELRRRVGYLGHANGLYDELTVEENVRFWARIARVPEPAAAADAALERLAVASRLRDLGVGRLSAGQRRRVALAAFVVRRPELWLLDEPHAGLDATARDDLDDLVREATAAGATVLVASHELERATALASRTVRLEGGVVVDVA
ncbi:MAG: heme ABC exporter ATP-binding protein CcmA [Actinobacteria bacterium]|nr:heme ABC exporter ATP-binding protein CcmA [Actinomycetota bacterium]